MHKCPECGFMAETVTDLARHWRIMGHVAPPEPAPPKLVINQIMPDVSPEDVAQAQFRDKTVDRIVDPESDEEFPSWHVFFTDGSSRLVERDRYSDADDAEPKEIQQLRQRVKGFTVTCNHCGSKNVSRINQMDYHPECGPWGGVNLRCYDCKDEVVLLEDMREGRRY